MKLQQDNRMSWIRNLETLNQSEEGSRWYELEIASECLIHGGFEYDNKKISCRFLTLEKDKNGLRKYLLRIQLSKMDFTPNYQGRKEGYYFIGGVDGELLALFSLFFQCKFYTLASYSFLSEHEKIKTESDFIQPKLGFPLSRRGNPNLGMPSVSYL
jgi:hypothetical protein